MTAWWEDKTRAEAESLPNPWSLRYGLTAVWEYDDNFSTRQSNGPDSEGGDGQIFALSPFGVLTFGEPGHGLDFRIGYAPIIRWFIQDNRDPLYAHELAVDLGVNGTRSRVNASLTYSRNEGGIVEVGEVVSSDTFSLQVGGSYDISPKTIIGATFGSTIAEYQTLNSFSNFTLGFFVDYAVTPKSRLGIGLGYDHLQQDLNLASNTFNLNLRFNWAATAKTGLTGVTGVEQREYQDGNSIMAGVGNLGFYYNPTDKVSFNFGAYRKSVPSISIANGMSYCTGAALSAGFEATARVQANMTLGYENALYEATGGPEKVDREDNYFFVRPSVRYAFSSHLSMNVFYQMTSNESSGTAANSFDRNQVGISLTLAY